MKKFSRIMFLLFGVVAPISVGALHTFVHFKELVSPEFQAFLSPEVIVNGMPTTYYNVLGLVSFMMGVSFIIIGLLNLIVFRKMGKDVWPPASNIIVMLLYLCCTIYAGNLFEAGPQFWGGVVGTIALSITLLLTLKNRNHA